MAPLRIRYQTLEIGDLDIHVRTLYDILQYLDENGVAEEMGISSATWPLFGIVWPSAQVLTHHLRDYAIAGKRILEVGCGIGLASLMLNCRKADITATDHHPEAENFLIQNTLLNNTAPIPFFRTGWCDLEQELGLFDLIIGSDLLYENDHFTLLSRFIDHHATPCCDVIIVDPGRGQHSRFSKKMVALGYTHTQHRPAHTDYLPDAFKGYILCYSRKLSDKPQNTLIR